MTLISALVLQVVQHVPWESVPLLRPRCVTRMPSLHFLHAHLLSLSADPASLYTAGVNTASAYYVLDPENNLQFTRDKFQLWFSR